MEASACELIPLIGTGGGGALLGANYFPSFETNEKTASSETNEGVAPLTYPPLQRFSFSSESLQRDYRCRSPKLVLK